MDKAIIVGIYEFIGYQLCETLLQEGIEVYGIHIPTNVPDHLVEEKRLLIGRNSNFYEKDENFLALKDSLNKETFIFFDYYSYYMKRQEDKLVQLVQSSLYREHLMQSVALMPIQFCVQNEDRKGNLKIMESPYIFYLPTIYGPWQPSNFLMHKLLCNPNENHVLDEREWTQDAIYVQDVIQKILYSLENQKQDSYLLKSNIENHWSQIVMSLTDEIPKNEEKNSVVNRHFSILEVNGITFEKGLESQKKYVCQMQSFH